PESCNNTATSGNLPLANDRTNSNKRADLHGDRPQTFDRARLNEEQKSILNDIRQRGSIYTDI
ncbi:MAG: hypothetical protein AAB433_08560, partial [Nitrospirota bacterium]